MGDKNNIGKVGWFDLTVNNADQVRDFYKKVIGWKSEPVSMGEYDDYNMISVGDNQPSAGICHAKGVNAGLPPNWMIYITVEDIDKSIASCQQLGGQILKGPVKMGPKSSYAILRDPSGAHFAIYCEE